MSRACPTPIKSVCVTFMLSRGTKTHNAQSQSPDSIRISANVWKYYEQRKSNLIRRYRYASEKGARSGTEIASLKDSLSSAMLAMSHQPNSSGVIITRFPLISGWCLSMGCSGTKSRLILMILVIEFAPLCKKMTLPNTGSKHYSIFCSWSFQ